MIGSKIIYSCNEFQMDKARRHELKMLKYKKRLLKMGDILLEGHVWSKTRKKLLPASNFHDCRNSGQSCSRSLCKLKYRNTKRKEMKEFKDGLDGFDTDWA